MKKLFAIFCSALCLLAVGCAGNDENKNTPPPGPSEGTLTVSDVYHYKDYGPIRIETRMDGKSCDGSELYYDVIDREICSVEDGYVTGLSVGTTQVYASTAGGQEVSFDVTIRDQIEFLYNTEVRTRDEDFVNYAGSPQNPTLFVGDSFFDERNFWRTFYSDFNGLHCFTVGISGSQTKHWYTAEYRLIKKYNPKNIVIHIGTNDINDTSIVLTVDGYYNKITAFLDTILADFPQVNVYYFGIENRNGDQAGMNRFSEAVTEKIKTEYAKDNAYFHYLDTPSIFNADPDKYVARDNIHPSVEGYKVYTQMLKEVVNF